MVALTLLLRGSRRLRPVDGPTAVPAVRSDAVWLWSSSDADFFDENANLRFAMAIFISSQEHSICYLSLLARFCTKTHTRLWLVYSIIDRNILLLITSAEEGGYVFGSVCLFVCLSVCLSVCPSDYSQTCERILAKFLEG